MSAERKDPFSWTKLFHAQEYNDPRKLGWTAEQKGWFWDLRLYSLCQEPQGSLPTDDKALAAVTSRRPRFKAEEWAAVLKLFTKHKGRLWLPESLKGLAERKKKSKAAKRSADARWKKKKAPAESETVLWRGISWPEWALKKLRLEVDCEADALKLAVDSLPRLEHTNPKKAALVKAERALYQADLTIMNATLKSIDAVLAAPAAHRGPGKVKVDWNGKEWYPSELVAELAQKREIKAALALPLTVNGKDQTLCAENVLCLATEKRSILAALQVIEAQTELNFRPSKQPSASRSVAVAVPGKSKKTRELPPDIQEQIDAAKRSLAA